jgi:hypothetical protein
MVSLDGGLRGFLLMQSWTADYATCTRSTITGVAALQHYGVDVIASIAIDWGAQPPTPNTVYMLGAGMPASPTVTVTIQNDPGLAGTFNTASPGSSLVLRVAAFSPQPGGAFDFTIDPSGLVGDTTTLGVSGHIQGTFQ